MWSASCRMPEWIAYGGMPGDARPVTPSPERAGAPCTAPLQGGCSESLGLKEGERFDPTGRVKACPAGRGGTWRHQRSPQIRPRLALSPAMTGKSRGRCRLARCLYLPLVCEENPVILTL